MPDGTLVLRLPAQFDRMWLSTGMRQFTVRAPALAEAVGLGGTTIDWEAVYAARSDASHGAPIELFAPTQPQPGRRPS